MRIPVIDDLAWIFIRLISLVQYAIFTAISKYYQPESLRDEIKMMNRIFSAWYLFSTSREELPEMIQDELIRTGRIMVGLLFIVFYCSII